VASPPPRRAPAEALRAQVQRLPVRIPFRCSSRGASRHCPARPRQAVSLGAGFWDLADEYGSHAAAAQALRTVDRTSVVIATKTTAKTRAACASALRRFLDEIHASRLDVVLLHAVSSAAWNRSRSGAMKALDEAKRAGTVGAVGVSAHSLAALRTAVEEPWVDVILVRLNHAGACMDGRPDEVLPLVRRAADAGKGVCAMKVQLVEIVARLRNSRP